MVALCWILALASLRVAIFASRFATSSDVRIALVRGSKQREAWLLSARGLLNVF
jgi:hypothetical protein